MDLSVVIVSYNVCGYLRQCLDSVVLAGRRLACEIIVVDNCSSDGSAEMVSASFPEVKVITSGTNTGFAAACNTGIALAEGRYILILNPDTVVDSDALTVAVDFMESHPAAGASGARMTDGAGRFLPESRRGFPSPLTAFFRFSGMGKLFPRSSFFNAYYLGHLPEDLTCRADILTGAFMMIRKKALDDSGLFDTAFFMYGEDIDLSWRLVKAGWVNYYLPEVHITHFKGKSADTNSKTARWHFYDAMIIFTAKHLPAWRLPVTAAVKVMYLLSATASALKRLIKS